MSEEPCVSARDVMRIISQYLAEIIKAVDIERARASALKMHERRARLRGRNNAARRIEQRD
jgi:hypothetical protein